MRTAAAKSASMKKQHSAYERATALFACGRSTQPVGADGDRVDVLYDPAGRLTPRPADAVDSPSSLLRWGVPLFIAGIVVRILSELRVSPFRTSDWG